jgi:hypothetical protein
LGAQNLKKQMKKQDRTMVGTNRTSIAQTDARKARAPRVVIVDEVTDVDKGAALQRRP